MIYLDNAATTHKKPLQVKRAMILALENCANAGRGAYRGAMEAAERVFAARESAAELFGIEDPGQVVFTGNATHALNLAIKGVLSKGNCVVSGYEHNSVLRPIAAMRKRGVTYTVARSRLFDSAQMIESFEKAIEKTTSCAVCTHVSNVFGYILPIKEIDELCFKKGIPLIIDASQSAGALDIKLSELQAAVCICAPGHKGLYGPQGTGILVCRNGESLTTLIEGGTGSVSSELSQPDFMPDRHESGTQNVPGISGLNAGIEYVLKRTPNSILRHERKLIQHAIEGLSKISGIRLYAAKDSTLQSGVLSFESERMSADDIADKLSDRHIAVRSGMHCAPIAHETVGTGAGTVRISVSDFTTDEDIEKFIAAMAKIMR